MILGISLNTRIVGMAILENTTLVEYQVKLFKEGWSAEKLERIIACIHRFANEYAVKNLACLTPFAHHQTPEIKQVIDQLKCSCKQKRFPIRFYTPQEICSLCEASRAKKRALMQALCLLYPELTLAEKRERRNRKRYYIKLFEAVGVATLLATELNQEI